MEPCMFSYPSGGLEVFFSYFDYNNLAALLE